MKIKNNGIKVKQTAEGTNVSIVAKTESDFLELIHGLFLSTFEHSPTTVEKNDLFIKMTAAMMAAYYESEGGDDEAVRD